MGWLSLHMISLLFAATAFGGMFLVTACHAPATFNALERPLSLRLMQHLFPRCRVLFSVILALATGFLFSAGTYRLEVAMFAACVGVFLAFRHILRPLMDALKELDQTAFNHPHRASVLFSLAQFAAISAALIPLVQ
jgi:hypothetical protein